MKRLALAAILLAAVAGARPTTAQTLAAQAPDTQAPPETQATPAPATQWRPAVYLLGTSERGSGPAYAPPLDRLRHDDAASVALGLDVRRMLQKGKLEASAFALAHDPASAADRGFFLAARARATFLWGDGAWTLRVEDSPRVQRRESVEVSDFERNELWAEIARKAGGTAVGLRVSDRRRSVRDDPLQGFARQWLSASVSGGSPGERSWRVEAGPQRYTTDVTTGWRLASALEIVARVLRAHAALRLLWIEPLSDHDRAYATGATPSAPSPSPMPPSPTPVPPEGYGRPPVADTVAPAASPQFSPPPPQLVSPVLIVDPLDCDEADWDFGRRKQELRLVIAGRLPGALSASFELRAQRERGKDVTVIGPEVDVRRDRFVLRGSLRRQLGTRLALLAEGSWQHVSDNRPGFAYTRTIVAIGVELRP